MRRFALILFSVFCAVSSFAVEVERSEAEVVAKSWMSAITGKGLQEFEVDSIVPCFHDSICTHFVVTFKPQGWVIVSSSDLVEPILGYSSESKIDERPLQFGQWMNSLSDQIVEIEREDIEPSREIAQKWLRLKENTAYEKSANQIVGPLLQTTWSQGKLFNELCPEDELSDAENGHVWAGCAATAMAQVMKYWEYPEHGFGSFAYDHQQYGTLQADFENAYYLWDSMDNTPSVANFEIQRLIYHAAVSVSMNFGASSSGSLITDTPVALEQYFGYNSSSFWTNSSSWYIEDWEELLHGEIDRGRPVLYMGYSQQSRVSHVFVLDGYNGDFYHFNWGWGGSADGYYRLSLLNPLAHNYSSDQAAILGIMPSIVSALKYPYSEGFETENPDTVLVAGAASYANDIAHTGTKSLLLGKAGLSSASKNSATLIFEVPANASLSFWVKRNSAEGKYNNNQSAVLLSQYGNQVVHEFFNGDFTDDDWVNYQYDLTDYFGQTLKLFVAEEMNVGAHIQYMYIDDISIVSSNQNLPPFVPSQPTPADKATSVALNSSLLWTGGDPNSDEVSYQVYFSKTYPPTLLQTTNETSISVELENNTKYYWQVKASDGEEISASPIWSFTTAGAIPVLATDISSVTKTSATVVGKMVAMNNARISERGVCLNTSPNPTWAQNRVIDKSSTDEFLCTVENLLPYTVYYARSYAFSNFGVAYGNCVRFHSGADLPKISIGEVTPISKYFVRVSAYVDEIMDTTILGRGVVWSATSDFNIDEAVEVISYGNWPNSGKFEVEVDGLPDAGTYYYRAFVENSVGRTYTDEVSFVTTNMAPVVNLDIDGSSDSEQNGFRGWAIEQQNSSLEDADFLVYDPDMDPIVSISFSLSNYEDGEDFLICLAEHPSLAIEGNKTDHLVVTSSSDLDETVWREVLSKTYLYNQSEHPKVDLLRKIEIVTSDGTLTSSPVSALLSMTSINDRPECVTSPVLKGTAELGSQIEVTAGTWQDLLDGCGDDFIVSYGWQIKNVEFVSDDAIVTIENESDRTLNIDERFCGKWIRAFEMVEDEGCYDDGSVTETVFTEWLKVEKINQEIFDVVDLKTTFGEAPMELTASSTSKLPVVYTVEDERVAIVDGAMLSIVGAGSTVVEVGQSGNECYASATSKIFGLVVDKADQQVLFNMPDTLIPASSHEPILVELSSGLVPSFSSSNENVASVCDSDFLCIQGEGSFVLNVHQDGNENYNAVDAARTFVVSWPLYFDAFSEKQFAMFPNPANDYVNIRCPQNIIDGALLKIFSVTGQAIIEQNILNEEERIPLSVFPEGVYLVQIQNGTMSFWSKLLINR